jgi:hypothetical protein
MKPNLANPVLADRGSRLAGVGFTDRLVPRPATTFPTAQASQAENPCAEPAAPSATSQGGAAFSHFTEASAFAEASADRSADRSFGNAIHLPDHMMVLVRAIAAYERCANERAIGLALKEYGLTIGAGPLARAVADLDDELAEVPTHARQAANRFRGGGP